MEVSRKRTHKKGLISALSEAQKLAFAPLTFQAVAALLELGILKEIDRNPSSISDLINNTCFDEYTVSTLIEIAEAAGIVHNDSEVFSTTQLGKAFLYDEMTRVNFNFVKDVCYKGADELCESFVKSSPEGLKKMYPEAKTIYPKISELPDRMRRSWYEFDHYYSDNCFEIIYKILEHEKKVFDIGANTGKFEKVCLKHNPDFDITMIDLPENIEFIKNDSELRGAKFHKADILSLKDNLPQISGAVLMSQFLDCFSKEQIEFILKKVVKSSLKGTKVFILEPFTDKQKFPAAKYSLIHTSLYFTCMANGCSKMYTEKEMVDLVEKSGLKVANVYDGVGAHDYTLLECVKND